MNIVVNILKIVGMIVLLFIISVFAQNLGILWHVFNWQGLEYVLHGLTNLVVAVLAVKLLVNKGLKRELTDYRVTSIRIDSCYLILGILLPIIVNLLYVMLIPGQFVITQLDSNKAYIELLLSVIFISGIVAPIVEEIVFRGILLKYVEEKTNIVFAIMLTSFLFSVVHIFNGKLEGIDLYLLIVAGFLAGMMYAIATYQFNSIWASVVLHACWNLSGIFTVTPDKVDASLFQYIIQTQNVWITGGAYGMDASLIAMGGYVLVIFILLFSQKRKSLKV
ncbi:CAAX protease [Staphylococcus microti]|uniref:CAAX amino terminal protease family protein n=1 Tax=Staphylococcus microti TaxID=569857 RepID=A0A0D6XP17_9STAP|nr:type II CAAX endopeptidase family protein [Staphylococcus microti]KIX90382.1 CAAX protease [Staphylococcus microti]PNZ77555.1 CPBP family intramembrane metalloprotease [Staphylococcus microti]SUM56414.1 CAAX amino terminal protease family protein [Staphylococcus microti]